MAPGQERLISVTAVPEHRELWILSHQKSRPVIMYSLNDELGKREEIGKAVS